jgi:lipid A 3-O-deacylase PagL
MMTRGMGAGDARARLGRAFACGILGCFFLLGWQGTARAGETGAPPDPGPETRTEGNRVFYRGLRERDFSAGYGFKIKLDRFEGRTNVPFYTMMARFGRFQTARRELLLEIPFTVFQEPDETTFGGGANAILRQHLTSGGKVVPFAELGAGGFLTNLDVKEVGGVFQFSLQGGLGLRYALEKNRGIVLTARWYHLSNGGLRSPNTGFNNGQVTLGYSILY